MPVDQQTMRDVAAQFRSERTRNSLASQRPSNWLHMKRLPMEGRFNLLPLRETAPGEREWALPGLVAGAVNAISAPGRAMREPGFNPEEEAQNFALNFTGGGLLASKQRGSIGMGGKLKDPQAPLARQGAPIEQAMQSRYGDFWRAVNLGAPDTPEFRRIFDDVTKDKALPDEEMWAAMKAHPDWLSARSQVSVADLTSRGLVGAAQLVQSLAADGISTRFETSSALGSRSTYIYATKGGRTVKIRLSDHPSPESSKGYAANDIATTPQHWKSAARRAAELLSQPE